MTNRMIQVFLLLHSIHMIHFTAGQVDTTGCSQKSLVCFDPVNSKDLCHTDADCKSGKTCCYTSCYKRCVAKRPCSNVLCKPTYLCQVVTTPCKLTTCNTEPSCQPAEEVNCNPKPTLAACPNGYERAKDQYGCRTGACQVKAVCPAPCKISCTFGQAKDNNGCPVCKCNTTPQDPCSKLRCAKSQECRQTTPAVLKKDLPAILQPGCVPKTLVPSNIDKSCWKRNPTTSGLPLLNNKAKEIDCATTACPPHSVCVAITSVMHRCCWQHTQLMVTKGPKVGECPSPAMIPYGITAQKCEVDAGCPDTAKCCYINRERGVTEYIGICLTPVHVTLSKKTLCTEDAGIGWFLKAIGVC